MPRVKNIIIEKNGDPQKDISMDEIYKIDPIDKLVTINVNTTVNTLKVFLHFIEDLKRKFEHGDMPEVFATIARAAPVIQNLLEDMVAGFQAYDSNQQALQLVTQMLGKGTSPMEGLDNIIKTMNPKGGNA